MNTTSRTKGYGLAVMTLAMFSNVACTQPTADDEEVAEAQDAILTSNSLTSNSLTSNSLTSNALNDPSARELLKYVVSCALPEGEHLDVTVGGVTYGFDGSLGVAPEWGEPGGYCDEECRSWVSGCVIARLDYAGTSVNISVRGKNDGLKSTPQERAQYSRIEATYYGDIFAEDKDIFACLPPGKYSIPRVCGPSLANCAVEVQGSCEQLCGPQRYDGSYPKCREASTGGWHWWHNQHHHHKGKKHVGSVTVFLK